MCRACQACFRLSPVLLAPTALQAPMPPPPMQPPALPAALVAIRWTGPTLASSAMRAPSPRHLPRTFALHVQTAPIHCRDPRCVWAVQQGRLPMALSSACSVHMAHMRLPMPRNACHVPWAHTLSQGPLRVWSVVLARLAMAHFHACIVPTAHSALTTAHQHVQNVQQARTLSLGLPPAQRVLLAPLATAFLHACLVQVAPTLLMHMHQRV